MNPQFFLAELPIVGILRGFTTATVIEAVVASMRGGLRNLEITMNSAGAAEQIREAISRAGEAMNIGAGTVIDLRTLDQALEAGACFIVTPVANFEVIAECVRRKIPVLPGAFSPTEIVTAWEAGAAMVKIFPAETLGPKYIKALKGPFPTIKLMPTGGVDLATIREFKAAGADAFGIGGPLFDRARVEAGDWSWVEAQCRAFVSKLVGDDLRSPQY